MLSSVQLTLMMGPVVASPVPSSVLDSLVDVEVTVHDLEPSGFKLTFSVDKGSPLQLLFLLTGGLPLLFMRCILVATVNGSSNVLIDGVITQNEIAPGDRGSSSTLSLLGRDLTALMDQVNWSGFPFPACPSEARVALLLAKYAFFGLLPVIIPSILMDIELPIDRIPAQQGSDLQYIRRLAEDAGYVFFVAAGPAVGTSVAYWGPQVKIGPVQSALNIDMDAYTNVESMHFKFDQEKSKIPLVYTYIQQIGISIPIPIPPVNPLQPPLGAIPPIPTNLLPPDLVSFRDDASKLSIPQLIMMGFAAGAESSECVSCEGSLDVTRYGGVLQARQLVGVRGAGYCFDGLYYVKSVTHRIKRGEYKQNFTLTRNGLVSTVSTVSA
ncbi:MAG: hypothetical protein WAL85_08175 [Candidatus Korobacteraceae bacterium]